MELRNKKKKHTNLPILCDYIQAVQASVQVYQFLGIRLSVSRVNLAVFSVAYIRFDLIVLTISIRLDYQFLGIRKMAALKITLAHSKSKIEANVKRALTSSKHHYFFHTHIILPNFMFYGKNAVPNRKRPVRLHNENNFYVFKTRF